MNKDDTFPPIIHQAMRYAIFNGGKRLRPIMVLEGSRIAGGNPEDLLNDCLCDGDDSFLFPGT